MKTRNTNKLFLKPKTPYKEDNNMANNTTKKVTGNKSVKEEKVMKTKETKKVETKKAAEVKETKKVEKKVNAKKESFSVPQMKNSELAKLFNDNGCLTKSKANDSSNVVYNTFGTESRVLQQKRAYQLLLTNGHDMVKGAIVDGESDDVARFTKWYKTLNKEQQAYINGFDTITATKLADSELPRERTVKVTNLDVLVNFIQFMSTFNENKVASTNK